MQFFQNLQHTLNRNINFIFTKGTYLAGPADNKWFGNTRAYLRYVLELKPFRNNFFSDEAANYFGDSEAKNLELFKDRKSHVMAIPVQALAFAFLPFTLAQQIAKDVVNIGASAIATMYATTVGESNAYTKAYNNITNITNRLFALCFFPISLAYSFAMDVIDMGAHAIVSAAWKVSGLFARTKTKPPFESTNQSDFSLESEEEFHVESSAKPSITTAYNATSTWGGYFKSLIGIVPSNDNKGEPTNSQWPSNIQSI